MSIWILVSRVVRRGPLAGVRFGIEPRRCVVTGAGWLRVSAVLLGAVLLSGCAGLMESGQGPARPDRFVLPDPETDVVGVVHYTVARHEDTLADFARRYGLGYDEIVAANPGVDPWLPGRGTRVVLPTRFVIPNAPRKGIIVNLATLRLFYFPEPAEGEPQVVVTHPIGIGREGSRTPVGRMSIIQKTENPTWTPPPSVLRDRAEKGIKMPAVVPPGPDNPLGAFAMRLSRPSYLLHGTNKPYGVGMRVSYGCIRLYPEDIERLFAEVPVGTSVNVVNQPYLVGRDGGEVYLEAHAPLAEEAARWKGSLKAMEQAVAARTKGLDVEIDWERAAVIAQEERGLPVPISVGSPGLDEVIARARRAPRIPPWATHEGETTVATVAPAAEPLLRRGRPGS
jgi:L,D-transpeptidase ErfK/SrfK